MSGSGYSNQRGERISGAEEVPLSTAEAEALAGVNVGLAAEHGLDLDNLPPVPDGGVSQPGTILGAEIPPATTHDQTHGDRREASTLTPDEAQALKDSLRLGGITDARDEDLGPAHEPTEAELADLGRPTGSPETDLL